MGSALLERVEAAANRDTYRLYSNAMNENQNSFRRASRVGGTLVLLNAPDSCSNQHAGRSLSLFVAVCAMSSRGGCGCVESSRVKIRCTVSPTASQITSP